jgi:hypothetical protein
MNVSWVATHNFNATDLLTADTLKESGPVWAPYNVWAQLWHDNVVSNDFNIARQLLRNKFNRNCNLWINDDFYVKLERPEGINTFEWQVSAEIENTEELICLQMAATRYDIIICVGWDLHSTAGYQPNTLEKHLRTNYLNYITAVVKQADAQFVFVDPKGTDIHPGLTAQDNFSTDTATNTLELLKQL